MWVEERLEHGGALRHPVDLAAASESPLLSP
jgi:hypothetical protein